MKRITTFALCLLIVCASMLGSCDNKKTTDSDDAVTTGAAVTGEITTDEVTTGDVTQARLRPMM